MLVAMTLAVTRFRRTLDLGQCGVPAVALGRERPGRSCDGEGAAAVHDFLDRAVQPPE